AIDAGRAAGDDVGIEHHEGHAAIPLKWVLSGEVAQARDLVVGEPVIAWHPGRREVPGPERCRIPGASVCVIGARLERHWHKLPAPGRPFREAEVVLPERQTRLQ